MLTGTQLRNFRDAVKFTQAQLGSAIQVSQKSISLWESRHSELPPDAVKKLQTFAKNVGVELPLSGMADGIASSSHSWPVDVFDLVYGAAPKRAELVTVRAIVSPSADRSFADLRVAVQYQKLNLGGGRLYMDHVMPPAEGTDIVPFLTLGGEPVEGPDGRHMEKIIEQGAGYSAISGAGASGQILEQYSVGPIRVRIEEDKKVNQPYTLAYEIFNADHFEPVTVFFKANRAFKIDELNAVGFPYYTEADFAISAIQIEVTFTNLIPNPDPPIPRAQLIRRTSFRPDNLHPEFGNAASVPSDNPLERRYTFGPLLRPKGGYFYSIAWKNLQGVLQQ